MENAVPRFQRRTNLLGSRYGLVMGGWFGIKESILRTSSNPNIFLENGSQRKSHTISYNVLLSHPSTGFLLAVLALCVSHIAALTLDNSNWIWKDSGYIDVDPFDAADFRRHFISPHRKQAVYAKILIAGDNNYTLYVNGEFIGQSDDWEISQQYCVKLNATNNLFAVANGNRPFVPGNPTSNPAAFIAAIQIFYHDGSSDTIVTDSHWLAHSATRNFYMVDFYAADWKEAFVAGSVNSPPWHVPASPLDSSSLSLSSSSWIWTNEVPPDDPTSTAPTGERAFRKTIVVPGGATVKSGVIIIDADNAYNLYINGKHIGSGATWLEAQRYKFTLSPPTSNVTIAVIATNFDGPAGLIAAIALNEADVKCSSTQFYTTDDTWTYHLTVPPGFQKTTFDDSDWDFATVEGPYGVGPWGSVGA